MSRVMTMPMAIHKTMCRDLLGDEDAAVEGMWACG